MENCIFHFQIMLEGFHAYFQWRSQSRHVHNKQASDLGIFNARVGPGRRSTLSFRILCLRHGAGWHNGLLQGALKRLAIKWFEGVLLGCCERLQVWNACFQEHWTKCMAAFSAPLVLPEKGESRGKQGHSRAICYSASECPVLSFPLVLVWLVRGADWDGTNSSLHNGRSRERQGKWGPGEWTPEWREDGLIVNCG